MKLLIKCGIKSPGRGACGCSILSRFDLARAIAALGCVLSLPVLAAGAEGASAALQKGLLEEEAHQNLPAAIQAYQSALKLFDEQRRIAATAAFRLGECYRKQGKTNEALAQFLRVTREFSDQTPLVTLSQKYLTDAAVPGMGVGVARGAGAGAVVVVDPEQTKLLREEINLVEQQIQLLQRAIQNGKASSADLVPLRRDLLSLQRKLPENSAPGQQQELINQEIQLAEQLLTECRKKIELGQATSADEIPLKRDVLRLKRELIAASQRPIPGAQSAFQTRLNSIVKRAPKDEGIGDEGAKEIEQIKNLLRDSPDLINARIQGGGTRLHSAAASGQLAVVRFLVENHADVNAAARETFESTERTPLHYAVNAGHKAIVEYLLAQGARVNARDRAGDTPLHNAASRGYQGVAQVLLGEGADVNARNDSGATPLHSAVGNLNPGMVELLLKHKADVNARNQAGDTPLLYAVSSKKAELVQLILAHKPDVNMKNDSGGTALTDSVNQKTDPITMLLLEHGADPNMLGIRVSAGPNFNTAPLHVAASNGDVELIQTLLKHGAKVNLLDGYNRTALLCAVAQGGAAVAELLRAGADPNLPANNGETPISTAIALDQKAVLVQLVSNRANVNAQNKGGATPLFNAVNRGRTHLAEVLLQAGADPNSKTPEGFTPLHLAAANFQVEMIELLLTKGAEVNAQDLEGNTPLHYAAYRGAKQAVLALLAHGAKRDLRNREGYTAAAIMQDNRYRLQGAWSVPGKDTSVSYVPRPLSAQQLELQKLLKPEAEPKAQSE